MFTRAYLHRIHHAIHVATFVHVLRTGIAYMHRIHVWHTCMRCMLQLCHHHHHHHIFFIVKLTDTTHIIKLKSYNVTKKKRDINIVVTLHEITIYCLAELDKIQHWTRRTTLSIYCTKTLINCYLYSLLCQLFFILKHKWWWWWRWWWWWWWDGLRRYTYAFWLNCKVLIPFCWNGKLLAVVLNSVRQSISGIRMHSLYFIVSFKTMKFSYRSVCRIRWINTK